MKHLKTLTLLILLLITTFSSAQVFEGEIAFKRINNYDETSYLYSVAHGKVRIDEFDKDKKVVGTMIVDLKSKSVIAINHERKMYMDVKSKPSTKDLSKCESFKTTEKKEILGYSCTKWTVSNPDCNPSREAAPSGGP